MYKDTSFQLNYFLVKRSNYLFQTSNFIWSYFYGLAKPKELRKQSVLKCDTLKNESLIIIQ